MGNIKIYTIYGVYTQMLGVDGERGEEDTKKLEAIVNSFGLEKGIFLSLIEYAPEFPQNVIGAQFADVYKKLLEDPSNLRFFAGIYENEYPFRICYNFVNQHTIGKDKLQLPNENIKEEILHYLILKEVHECLDKDSIIIVSPHLISPTTKTLEKMNKEYEVKSTHLAAQAVHRLDS